MTDDTKEAQLAILDGWIATLNDTIKENEAQLEAARKTSFEKELRVKALSRAGLRPDSYFTADERGVDDRIPALEAEISNYTQELKAYSDYRLLVSLGRV